VITRHILPKPTSWGDTSAHHRAEEPSTCRAARHHPGHNLTRPDADIYSRSPRAFASRVVEAQALRGLFNMRAPTERMCGEGYLWMSIA
jgi:hypothetical protein